MRRNERTELRLVRVMVDVKGGDLGMMTSRGKIDIVPDPVMRRERTDIVPEPVMRILRIDIVSDPVMRIGRIVTAHDPMKRGVYNTAQPTGTKEKTVNLPDRDSIEKRKQGDHTTIGIHHLDRKYWVILYGMVIPNRDPGRWIGIDVQRGIVGTKQTEHGTDMEIGNLVLVPKIHSQGKRLQEVR
jgi:hypothetical protein